MKTDLLKAHSLMVKNQTITIHELSLSLCLYMLSSGSTIPVKAANRKADAEN